MIQLELPFRVYGLILTLGIVLGFFIVSRIAEKENYPKDLVWDSLPWLLISGLIGARLYHVIDLWEYYAIHPLEIMAVWRGGIGIFGALAGGVVGTALYLNYGKSPRQLSMSFQQKLLTLLDLSVFGVPLSQAIGRWGNYVNHELYGLPSNVPWAIEIPLAYRFPKYQDISTYHPLFLYESILSLGLWLLLFFVWKKRKIMIGTGKLLALYLIGYGVIRSVLEPLRIERWEIGSVPTAVLVSCMLVVIGLILVFKKDYAK